MKKILRSAYSLNLKNIVLFLNRSLIFFSNGRICNVVSTLLNVVKIDVENDNVVSTLSNVVQFNVEIHNVVSTLLNLVNYNFDVNNVVSTLIWRCAMSRLHINLKTTLSQRWSVCWVHFSIKKGRAPVSMHCLISFLEIWKLNNHKFSAWDCWCCYGHEIYFNLCFELF